MTVDYLVQQVDGTSRFTLQDGTGFILLQSSTAIFQKLEILLQIPSTQDQVTLIPSIEDQPIQLNDNEDILVLG